MFLLDAPNPLQDLANVGAIVSACAATASVVVAVITLWVIWRQLRSVREQLGEAERTIQAQTFFSIQERAERLGEEGLSQVLDMIRTYDNDISYNNFMERYKDDEKHVRQVITNGVG